MLLISTDDFEVHSMSLILGLMVTANGCLDIDIKMDVMTLHICLRQSYSDMFLSFCNYICFFFHRIL